MSGTGSLLSVRDLCVRFDTPDGSAAVVENVSFEIRAGETLGLVGESGCGKTVTALSILRLIAEPPGRVTGGEILFGDVDLLSLGGEELRRVRGDKIGIIFQEPMSCLNPVFNVGGQIREAILAHRAISRKEARKRVYRLLDRVGIADPENSYNAYPHELSGGMRQRVIIAMALACTPRLLIADEPATALDVTVQAQIIRLLRSLQESHGMSILLISHDLSLLAQIAHRIAVMYAARIVESGRDTDIYSRPVHPYTLGLLKSIPAMSQPKKRLSMIPGSVPDAAHYPAGCRFAPRCPFAREQCAKEIPPMSEIEPGHAAACWEWRQVRNYLEASPLR